MKRDTVQRIAGACFLATMLGGMLVWGVTQAEKPLVEQTCVGEKFTSDGLSGGGPLMLTLKCEKEREGKATDSAAVIASYLKNPGPLTCRTNSLHYRIDCDPRN